MEAADRSLSTCKVQVLSGTLSGHLRYLGPWHLQPWHACLPSFISSTEADSDSAHPPPPPPKDAEPVSRVQCPLCLATRPPCRWTRAARLGTRHGRVMGRASGRATWTVGRDGRAIVCQQDQVGDDAVEGGHAGAGGDEEGARDRRRRVDGGQDQEGDLHLLCDGLGRKRQAGEDVPKAYMLNTPTSGREDGWCGVFRAPREYGRHKHGEYR